LSASLRGIKEHEENSEERKQNKREFPASFIETGIPNRTRAITENSEK
jgi:hypothetical protein